MSQSATTIIFGQRIKEIRKSKNISPRWIAKKVGITKSEYLDIEAGSVDEIDLEVAGGIAFVLDVNMNYLAGVTNDILPSNQSELLNEFDVNNESEKITRKIIHGYILMSDEERKEFLEILKERGLLKK